MHSDPLKRSSRSGADQDSRAVVKTFPSHFQTVEKCRMCDSPELLLICDLGIQATAGRFPDLDEPDPPAAPLQLAKCTRCGLVQLRHNFALDELYRQQYGYRSGINLTMRRHLAGIAAQVENLVQFRSGDTVLDIASNDGTLLKSYVGEHLVRIGIDPTIIQFKELYTSDLVAVPAFFSSSAFFDVSSGKKARAVTSIAMLYDLPDPHAFVSQVAEVLERDGVWISEQSDIGMMLEANAFDTICHEHLEYYAYRQLEQLVSAHGLRIFDVQFGDINGGSCRIFCCHTDAPFKENTQAIKTARSREERLKLDDLETYDFFWNKVVKVRSDLRVLLMDLRKSGHSIHVYGASTKGNVLLQFCGIDKTFIDAAAERNPEKWGRRTPGTAIPIISEEQSRRARPDYYLVLPWHFRREFELREAEYVAQGGKLIFPLPVISIFPA